MIGMSARRTIATGILIVVISAVAFVVATLLGAKLGKYPAAAGVVGLCIGASIVLNGALDWWRG